MTAELIFAAPGSHLRQSNIAIAKNTAINLQYSNLQLLLAIVKK